MEWDGVGDVMDEESSPMTLEPTFDFGAYPFTEDQDHYESLGWGAVGLSDGDLDDYFALSSSLPDASPDPALGFPPDPVPTAFVPTLTKSSHGTSKALIGREGTAIYERLTSFQFLVRQKMPRANTRHLDIAIEHARQFLLDLGLLPDELSPRQPDPALEAPVAPPPVPSSSSNPSPFVFPKPTAPPQPVNPLFPSASSPAPSTATSFNPTASFNGYASSPAAFTPSSAPSTPSFASATEKEKDLKRKSDRMEQSEDSSVSSSSASTSSKKGGDMTFKFHHETESSLRTKAEEKRLARGQKKFRVMTPNAMKSKLEETQRSSLLASIGRQPPKPPLTASDFERLIILTHNAFGSTRLVKNLKSKKYFALKSVFRSVAFKHDQLQHLANEKRIMLALSAPFFIKMFGTFSDRQSVHFLFEYVPGGDLLQYIRSSGKFPAPVAKFYMAEIALALEYLHERQITFRDLKPENVLLDEDGHIKLSDFGFARQLTPGEKAWTFCGTADYIAPEVIAGVGHDLAVDWWALGVLLFEMCVGFPPFAAADPMAIFENVSNSHRLQYPDFLDPYVADIIRRLLQPDPSVRLGATGQGVGLLKSHAWFQVNPVVDWNEFRMRMTPAPIVPKFDSLTQNYPPLNDDGRFKHDATVALPTEIEHFFNTF